MKTKLITGLKKEVLVIEAKSKDIAWGFMFNKYGVKELLKWEVLGKPDEIKEEDAEKLVESWESVAKDGTRVYENYKNGIPKKRTALESFNSALESEIYWDNPWGDRMPIFVEASPSAFKFVEKEKERWKEAQEKTFDKKRTLIFVKNKLKYL